MTSPITAFPLCWPPGWPRTNATRRMKPKFSTKVTKRTPQGNAYQDTVELTIAEATARVLAELRAMAVSDDVVISSNVRLRLDGLPRSGEPEPADVGVAVYWRDPFHLNDPPRCMAIDIYATTAGNLGAVAATLAALRAIERHGGAQILDRAFAGFVALADPAVHSCWEMLGISTADGVGVTRADINAAFRYQAAHLHPDHGGSNERMAELNAARDEALRKAGC